jgi:hypothetical protein
MVLGLGVRNEMMARGGEPTFPSERLRERQEAAGNGLNNQDERGGCLLFARRNG